MKKHRIKNRKEQNIVVIVEKSEKALGLAFVMHGLGGFKEQPHIKTVAKTFLEKGFTVVRFDTTNTFGESDGNYEDATITNYYEDLEDVIEWASTQEWYQEPFCLSGHSLGGICVALYVENHPDKVQALAPLSPVVSGELSFEARKKYRGEEFEEWQKTGWLISESHAKPGITKRLKWSHMEDRLKYDLLPKASKLTMPVLLIVGERDHSTPPEHVRQLYEALPGPKEFCIIKGARHTFREQKHLKEIKNIFLNWIEKRSA